LTPLTAAHPTPTSFSPFLTLFFLTFTITCSTPNNTAQKKSQQTKPTSRKINLTKSNQTNQKKGREKKKEKRKEGAGRADLREERGS
jgi:hypothetical protein